MEITGTLGSDLLRGTARADIIHGAPLGSPATTATLAPLVAGGLGDALFALSPPGDGGTLLVVTKSGLVRAVDLGTGTAAATPFLDLRGQVATAGEQGLLGMAFHPNHATNGKVYVYLSTLAGDTEVREYTVAQSDPTRVLAGSGRTVLTIDQPPFSNHKAGWIGFDAAGRLMIASGDGGGSGDPLNTGQNPFDLLGSILRIDVDADAFPGDPLRNYAIPADNPFADGVAGAPEVWAYGLRNPFRASIDRATDTLWIGDVGQGAREEVNLGAPGANYGWDLYEGTLTYPGGAQLTPPFPAGFTFPLFEYGHDQGDRSIIGGIVHRGPETGLQGSYVFGDFASGRIWSLSDADNDGSWTRALLGTVGGFTLSSFAEDAEGRLYAVTLGGALHRIETGAPAGTPDGDDTIDGLAGDDRIFAGAGNDIARGHGGDDLLNGMEGNDTLASGIGEDTLIGGAGADLLWGGAGADRFRFVGFGDSPAEGAPDRILDFDKAEGDRIDLGALVAGRFAFIGEAPFAINGGPQVRVVDAGAMTRVEATAASGIPDLVILLEGRLSLAAGDFIL